ncbi:MAG TPA: hypothetical protein VKB45_08230 [Gemmatimonadales bacterium]|nr:hypothetical protein [Gemmatimonadales bacterium]
MSDPIARLPARPSLEQLRKQAKELSRSADIPLHQAQHDLARRYGFESWPKLLHHVAAIDAAAAGRFRVDEASSTIEVRGPIAPDQWAVVIDVMHERGITGLRSGAVTDAALERIATVEALTRLEIEGEAVTDAGLRHLARLPGLQELNVGGPKALVTDAGLEVLRDLRGLRRFVSCWTPRISDAGVANLSFCDELEHVNLMGTPTGDGAINALRGKRRLRHLKTGRLVTDAGVPLLHDFPVLKTWHGGEGDLSLMSFDSEPNHLLLDGPFTDRGLASLRGLDGLYGVHFFWHVTGMTANGLEALADLPHLEMLGCEGTLCNDLAMRQIGGLPGLRMLMAQGTVASDAGFQALARSRTIEFIWGRECPNLTGPGFRALAGMPALQGLGVSCKMVDDASLAALPGFPALTQLMPMDVTDDGFRHVGRCAQLEKLWCMYCRTTGDGATEHITGLARLKSYYAGRTLITDASLELLAAMSSLEELEFWETAGITNAGIAALARLPRLKRLEVGSTLHVTRDAFATFPPAVHISYW